MQRTFAPLSTRKTIAQRQKRRLCAPLRYLEDKSSFSQPFDLVFYTTTNHELAQDQAKATSREHFGYFRCANSNKFPLRDLYFGSSHTQRRRKNASLCGISFPALATHESEEAHQRPVKLAFRFVTATGKPKYAGKKISPWLPEACFFVIRDLLKLFTS